MSTIDQIANQASNFAQEISLGSVGSFGGRIVRACFTTTSVIFVTIAAILAVGLCIYHVQAQKSNQPSRDLLKTGDLKKPLQVKAPSSPLHRRFFQNDRLT